MVTRADPASAEPVAEHCFECLNRERTEWCVLTHDDVDLLDRAKVQRVYQAGQVLFDQGDPADAIYDMQDGMVGLRRTDEGGHTVLVALIHARQTLGYRDFFADSPRHTTAEVLRPSTICTVNGETMHRLLVKNPALGLQFLRRIARDLDTAEEMLLHQTVLPVRARLAHLLLTLRIRYGQAAEDGSIALRLPLRRQDLADLLGTRPETVTRAFQALARDRVIRVRGRRVIILDLDSLLDEIEPHAV